LNWFRYAMQHIAALHVYKVRCGKVLSHEDLIMGRSDETLTLQQNELAASFLAGMLLTCLAKTWGVSEQEALQTAESLESNELKRVIDPEALLLRKKAIERLAIAIGCELEKLPPSQAVVARKWLEGKSAQEIALETGRSIKTVSPWLRKAQKRLLAIGKRNNLVSSIKPRNSERKKADKTKNTLTSEDRVK